MTRDPLRPLSKNDFIVLASESGMSVDAKDLDELEKRQLLLPAGGDGEYTVLHLFGLARYFDSVRVIRHPWFAVKSETTADQVKDIAALVVEVVGGDRGRAAELTLAVERYLATIDPFGPVSAIVDVLRPDIIRQLRGAGRLYVELRLAGSALADLAEGAPAPVAEEKPPPSPSPAQDLRSTAIIDRTKEHREAAPSDQPVAIKIRDEEGKPTTERTGTAQHAKPTAAPPPPPKATAAPPTPELEADDDHNDVEAATERITITPELADQLDSAKRKPGPPPAKLSDPAAAAGPAKADPPEKSDQPAPPPKSAEESEQPAAPRDAQAEIVELNELRERYLKAQDFGALVDLYESKLDLFENEDERQQILLTIGALCERKLGAPARGFKAYAAATKIGPDDSRAKARDAVRRLGADLDAEYKEWLQGFWLLEELSPAQLRTAQSDVALIIHREGAHQNAFLTFATFLADDPDARVTAETVEVLCQISKEISVAEVDGVFGAIVDSGPAEAVVKHVSRVAGIYFADAGEYALAKPYLRRLVEVGDDDADVLDAWIAVAEADGDPARIVAALERRIPLAEGADREALENRLEQAKLGLDPEQVLAQAQGALGTNSADVDAIGRMVWAYEALNRPREAYEALRDLAGATDDDDAICIIQRAMGSLAANQMKNSAVAADHYQTAVDHGAMDRSTLEALARARIGSGNWRAAVDAVHELTDGDADLSESSMIEWLALGIDAAEKSSRPDDRARFAERLMDLAPSHEKLTQV